MEELLEKVLGKKISGTRIVPLLLKIVLIFTVFLLVSNFTSNYINLMLNRGVLVKLMNQLLIKDLKDIYSFAANQHEIYSFNQDLDAAVNAIEQNALGEMKNQKSIFLGIRENGTILFQSSPLLPASEEKDGAAANSGEAIFFEDSRILNEMNSGKAQGIDQGSVSFHLFGHQYFGAYKYTPKWDLYLLRAEELQEFYSESTRIFWQISALIIFITIFCIIVGIQLLRYILRFVGIMTNSIMNMQEHQVISKIDIAKAPNDDVTFLGIAFNSLSDTIENLLTIFKKFVARDVAIKAYQEREIRLEGGRKELTILFTDIRSFTFMTETLGIDIIKLLNMHYDRAIHYIHEYNGDIGSIIGDAVLAIFGIIPSEGGNKSHQAIQAGYKIQEVAQHLREEMHKRREEIIRTRGALTSIEEEVYKAVLLEVGIGIDGGTVFYGNIGSKERMVNTVIGDNVNSSSRLEGLTKVYRVPIIVSEYIKNEVEVLTDDYYFMELDQVMVKGKTLAKKIYWPIISANIDNRMRNEIDRFSTGLQFYYEGKWEEAYTHFSEVDLVLADVYKNRTKHNTCPENWNGIWTMDEK